METDKIEDDVIIEEDEHVIHTPESVNVDPDKVIEIIQRQRLTQVLNKEILDPKLEAKVMDDLTKTALTQKRLSTDEKAADASGELAKAIGSVITSGITLAQSPDTKVEKVLPSLEGEVIEKFEITPELLKDGQEEIPLDEIMKAETLKD